LRGTNCFAGWLRDAFPFPPVPRAAVGRNVKKLATAHKTVEIIFQVTGRRAKECRSIEANPLALG
jgi:hypothetical protein